MIRFDRVDTTQTLLGIVKDAVSLHRAHFYPLSSADEVISVEFLDRDSEKGSYAGYLLWRKGDRALPLATESTATTLKDRSHREEGLLSPPRRRP